MSSSEEVEFDDDTNKDEEVESSSDDDDDIPLSKLVNGCKKKNDDNRATARKRKVIDYDEEDEDEEEEEEFDGDGGNDNDDDVDDDDDDDDDDDGSYDSDEDIPLSQLKKQSKAPVSASKSKSTAKKASARKSTTPVKKRKAEKKEKIAKKKSKKRTSSSSKKKEEEERNQRKKDKDSFDSKSNALYETECTKGLLIQRLLCRWWYCITWPDPSRIPEKPPQNYDSLDGFPGVYACTSGGNVGHILDVRDNENRPSFESFLQKPAEELVTLLLKALENQKIALIESEGEGTITEKEINTMIRWAKSVDKPAQHKKAEKEAAKILKTKSIKMKT